MNKSYEYVLEKTREKKCVNIYIYIYINTLTDFAKSYVLFAAI